MKKTTLFLFFVFSSFSILGQNKQTKIADKLFNSFDYSSAALQYEKLVAKGFLDSYIYNQLGMCYYKMTNTIEAERWYSKVNKPITDAETVFNFAQVLKSNGKYEESDREMKLFCSMLPNDNRALKFNQNSGYLQKIKSADQMFEVKKMTINSNKSDFGAVLYDDILYFVSARKQSAKLYKRTNEPFLDLYQSRYNYSDETFSQPVALSELNTSYHEGPVTISNDGMTMYFSSESFNDKLFVKDDANKLKYGQVNLFKASKIHGKWTSIVAVPFNSKYYSTGNPTINKDGNVLYFASNMPGSIGGTDIWKVDINSDGSFGTPQNMGDKINTVGDENFPFISDDDVLYFSSNGLSGFGGLDVFSFDSNVSDNSINLGIPINSEKDDFAFTFNKNRNIGFLSSNRSGLDDLYNVVPLCKSEVTVVVRNSKTGVFLANSNVTFLDSNKTSVESQITNNKGEVIYNSSCGKKFSIVVYKDGFMRNADSPLVNTNGMQKMEISLDPLALTITENEIELNPIYFEFNKSEITPEVAAELDKLAYIMAQNKKLNILIKSHTDNVGNEKYNLNLSQIRANSTLEYLVSKGIALHRIEAKGVGETEPKVNCNDNCSDADHAMNRRLEFIIVK